MAKKPFDIDEYPQEFEKLSEQPNLSEYNLFLQDFAGQNTPIITLDIIDG